MQTAPTTSPKTDLSDVTLEGAPGGARKEGASQVGALIALELRLAAAVESGKELDAQIGRAFGVEPKRRKVPKRGHYVGNQAVILRVEDVFPPYTSSIDAALTLVPEGWSASSNGPDFNSKSGNIDQYFGYVREHQPYRDVQDHPDAEGSAHHVSRAIALCLAAIRARISQSSQE